MPVTAITSLQEFNEIINGDRVAIIDFWATWCGSCRVISPVLDGLSDSSDYAAVGFYKVDVDAQPDVAQEVGLRAMPTFQVFKGGARIGELVGADPAKLQALVQTSLASVQPA